MGTKSTGRLTAHYSVMQSFYWMSGCCLMAFASVFLISRGFSNTEAGAVISLSNLLCILCQPFVAGFADRTKKIELKQIVACLLGITGLCSVLLGLLPALFWPTALLFLLLTGVNRLQQSLYTSLAMDHINSGTALNFSLGRGIGSFAFATVSLIMGYAVDYFGGNCIVWFNAAFTVCSIIAVLTFRSAKRNNEQSAAKAMSLPEFAKKNFRFILAVLSLVLVYLSHTFINVFTIRIMENVGGSGADMGIATAIGGFLELPAMAAFPFILKKVGSAAKMIKIASFFMVVKTVITMFAPSVGFIYFAQCFQMIAFGLLLPSCIYYVNRVIPASDRVKGQACMDLAMSVSSILGSLMGGMLIDLSGVPFMLTVGTVVSAIGFIALLFTIKKD